MDYEAVPGNCGRCGGSGGYCLRDNKGRFTKQATTHTQRERERERERE